MRMTTETIREATERAAQIAERIEASGDDHAGLDSRSARQKCRLGAFACLTRRDGCKST